MNAKTASSSKRCPSTSDVGEGTDQIAARPGSALLDQWVAVGLEFSEGDQPSIHVFEVIKNQWVTSISLLQVALQTDEFRSTVLNPCEVPQRDSAQLSAPT